MEKLTSMKNGSLLLGASGHGKGSSQQVPQKRDVKNVGPEDRRVTSREEGQAKKKARLNY
jgi:hypothetical protein